MISTICCQHNSPRVIQFLKITGQWIQRHPKTPKMCFCGCFGDYLSLSTGLQPNLCNSGEITCGFSVFPKETRPVFEGRVVFYSKLPVHPHPAQPSTVPLQGFLNVSSLDRTETLTWNWGQNHFTYFSVRVWIICCEAWWEQQRANHCRKVNEL